MRFDEPAASLAINRALSNPELAQIYLIFRGTELAGYFALTFCFSLEFHGRFALFDELYLREPFRRQKLGKAVVAFAEDLCKKAGIKALRLEVGRENQPRAIALSRCRVQRRRTKFDDEVAVKPGRASPTALPFTALPARRRGRPVAVKET